MQLQSLHIQNFRALQDFKVNKLGRLNLIVGGNNSGKSSILEAIRIYSGNANRALLNEIASDHDEKYYSEINEPLPFESFFSGRTFDGNNTISIGEVDNENKLLRIQYGFQIVTEEVSSDRGFETRSIRFISQDEAFQLKTSNQPSHISPAILVSRNDKNSFLIPLDDVYRSRRYLGSNLENQELFPCSTIPTKFISLDELADEWDKIALTDFEEQIKNILKLIEDKFENLAFVKDDSRRDDSVGSALSRRALKRYAKVKLTGLKHTVPLKSMGDGVLRLLQLAIKLFSARGGILLIDEFENGLHFSVQEKVWDWLFYLAEKLDIQVFATTHSWDCVESFSNAATNQTNIEAVLFRVGRSVRDSDSGKLIATLFDREQLHKITQLDVEVR